MDIVRTEELSYDYIKLNEEGEKEDAVRAVDHVNLHVKAGDFIAILGHNGSGKSTLAKHINAILQPSEGTVYVDGKDTKNRDLIWEIRQTAGMVFQNPDNQIIGTVVDEDVAFGPENMGVPREEILERVEQSLRDVGMWDYRSHSPNRLSGGQKQRVAIAGVIAMRPKCIVLDEPTAMLDPGGRREVIETALELNRTHHVTIILITHNMEEAVFADQIIVMSKGKIALQGTPREVFSKHRELVSLGMEEPHAARLSYELRAAGLPLPEGILTKEELLDALEEIRSLHHGNNN